MTRFVSLAVAVCFIISLWASLAIAADAQPVQLHFMDQVAPAVDAGEAFGVPWPQGALQKSATFGLTTSTGTALPLQSWPMAYWPDGSLKWTGFATTAGPASDKSFTITPNAPSAAPATPVKVTESDTAIDIATGTMTVRINKTGQDLIDSISLGNTVVANHGHLVASRQDRSQFDTNKTIGEEDFTSQIDKVTLEQSGPVRAVVKVEGKHKADQGNRAWLPFIVRLYVYAGSNSIRMVHTFIYDGDQVTDFVSGLGIRFSVPMRQAAYNRHVRFAGDTGMWAEPIEPMANRRVGAAQLMPQAAGQPISPPAGANQLAVWNAYKLVQTNSESYTITKRTNAQSAWIHVNEGNRSLGSAFIGDTSGGLSVEMKNFWQLAPTEMEVQGAGSNAAQLTMWLYSPDVQPMDMRPYDTVAHGLDYAYEDVQPGFSYATGMARTSELTIRPYLSVPSDQDLLTAAKADQAGSLLACSPQYLHDQNAFGVWGLPDRSKPVTSWIEDQLDKNFAFYHGQVDQQHWYGFWDFGDIMRSYDSSRHEWEYDMGGFAWDDTELCPNYWLWLEYLRTGRGDVFRMAVDMTRNTQEVDVYHLGKFAGLGSRHNVRHWGDGAKEVRISQSMFKRPMYYLTTDERTGDLMTEQNDVENSLLVVDPLREILTDRTFPTHVRIGPDWLALVTDWYTAYERTLDKKYLDKINTGINCILAFPNGVASGDNYGFDPKSEKISLIPGAARTGSPSLLALFGGPEFQTEIIPTLNNPAWASAWLKFCRGPNSGTGGTTPRFSAYAAYIDKNPTEAQSAWTKFYAMNVSFNAVHIADASVAHAVDEIASIDTTSSSQFCINAIDLEGLIGNYIDATTQPPAGRGARGSRGAAPARGGAAPAETTPPDPAR